MSTDSDAGLTIVVCQSGSLGQVQVMRLMYPNIDVIHMAGYLRENISHADVSIVDGYVMKVDETIGKIVRKSPDILFLHGDTPTATAIYKIANETKMLLENPVIVIFGEHSSALPLEPFEQSRCDVVILGDPESTAYELSRLIADSQGGSLDFARIENIVYRSASNEILYTKRDNRALDLDDLARPARDLVNMSAYRGTYYKISSSETSVLAARGCPCKCTYCGQAWQRSLERPRFRYRSPKSLVDEMGELQREYGIHDFLLDISTFNFNLNWSIDVCREIVDRGLKFNLKSHLRADKITPELLGSMRQAGFWLVYVGIESIHDRTLAGVKKEITVKQIESALVKINAAGMKTVAELMNCLFWEENGELIHEGFIEAWETLRFARELYRRGLIHAMYWTPMMPVPASESYSIALRHNLIDDGVRGKWHLWFPVQRPVVLLPGISRTSWYLIQWLGKVQQVYFLLASQMLHRSRIGLILKRASQLFLATVRGAIARPNSAGKKRLRSVTSFASFESEKP